MIVSVRCNYVHWCPCGWRSPLFPANHKRMLDHDCPNEVYEAYRSALWSVNDHRRSCRQVTDLIALWAYSELTEVWLEQAHVSQLAEDSGREPEKCRFESCREHHAHH